MKVKAIIGSIVLGLSLNANAFIGDETGPCIYEALLYNTGPYMSCGPMAGEQWTHELEKEFQELVEEIKAEMGDLVGSREGMDPGALQDPYAEYYEKEVSYVSDEPDFQLTTESTHITGNVYATSMVFTAIENSATLKAVKFNRGN